MLDAADAALRSSGAPVLLLLVLVLLLPLLPEVRLRTPCAGALAVKPGPGQATTCTRGAGYAHVRFPLKPRNLPLCPCL